MSRKRVISRIAIKKSALYDNKDKNVHGFALSTLPGELLEREERESWDIIHGLPIIHGKD